MRNRTAAFYRILEVYPLSDILAMEAGAFDDERDGDKAVMDWLIAVGSVVLLRYLQGLYDRKRGIAHGAE